MTESIITYEKSATEEWMKQRSLELMRDMRNPEYPPRRLTYNDGAYRGLATGKLYLPFEKYWHAPTRHDETITPELIREFETKGYELDNMNQPVHPWADEMLDPSIGTHTGKGFYREFGANRTADPAIFRFDQGEPLILLVQRGDSGEWALPGGFIDGDEDPVEAALREGAEETIPGYEPGDPGYEPYGPSVTPLYQGLVADRRATLNAWPETNAYVIRLDPSLTHDLPVGAFQGDPEETKAAGWFTLDQAAQLPMFGSHALLIELAITSL